MASAHTTAVVQARRQTLDELCDGVLELEREDDGAWAVAPEARSGRLARVPAVGLVILLFRGGQLRVAENLELARRARGGAGLVAGDGHVHVLQQRGQARVDVDARVRLRGIVPEREGCMRGAPEHGGRSDDAKHVLASAMSETDDASSRRGHMSAVFFYHFHHHYHGRQQDTAC
jgi:hypothetical protein